VSTLLTACRRTISLAALAALVVVAQTQERSVWDGVYTAQQAARGRDAYANLCASCHGTDLTGGESAPPLMGGEFLANWNGLTVGDLFERIRTTMPASRPGSVSREQNSEVLAFILSANQFPAGSAELPRQTEALKQIRLESTRPEPRK